MTQGIVSAVVKKLADLLVDEVRSLGGVEGKVDQVKLQLGQMQCFLEDADSKKNRGDERIKGWVRDVRSVAYETEGAINTFLAKTNRQTLGFILNRLLACRALGHKISKIQAKLRIISEGRITFGIQDLSEDRDHSVRPLQKHPVLPDVDNGEIVGFEAEKGDIINLLLNRPSDQSRHVVSIVGPGGLGKTTLAQKVCSCRTITNHFDSCIWITVSHDFNLLDVLKKVHQKLEQKPRLEGESQKDQIVFLLGEVNALLKKKKYLIVLDDVWTEDVFTQLETGLVDIGNGSRVLMTSRFLNVANCADSSGVYRLRFLNEEESLGLFLKKALQSCDPLPKCPDDLSDIARKLVRRCEGLPLAIIVLGGLLSNKPSTHRAWSTVSSMLTWHIDGQECMEILSTSYDDLKYDLKSCFRYLACFPKDFKIPAKPLMKMWIAEGLIEVQGEGELEDYAEDYLEELVQRCLVQVVERSLYGAIKSIRVHDLLREVALREATENDFLLIWKEENAKRDVSMTRRVAFHEAIDASSSIYDARDLTKIKMPNLRTFLTFDRHSIKGIGFLLLRVLELRNAAGFDLPMDMRNMIHLRYLGLRGTGVTAIPTWIADLQNLQTFDIKGIGVKQLPEVFWKITSLRHVHCSAVYDSSGTILVGPPSTANLVNLRSLGRLQVPLSWKRSLPHLFGIRKLQLICYDENDGILIRDLISNLNHLHSVRFDNFYPPSKIIDFSTSPSYHNIHTMYLSGYELGPPPTVQIARMPPNLTKLTLSSFRLYNDPMPELEILHTLKYLELNGIRIEKDTISCTYGGFPRLQTLKLDYVPTIKKWDVHYGALPALKFLLIKSCYCLNALPDLRHVTTLQELRIDEPLRSEIKNETGEEWWKFEHIPTII